MPKPKTRKRKEPHTETPPAYVLYNFVDHTLQGILYKKDVTISIAKMKKLYDTKPRTEITITRLK